MLFRTKTILLWLTFCWLAASRAVGQEDFDNAPARAESLLEQADGTQNAVEAMRLARQALSMAKTQPLALRAHKSLAEASARANEPDTAIVHFLEAEKIARRIISKPAVQAELNASLGEVFMRAQLYANAAYYFSTALDIEPENFALREKLGDAYLLDSKISLAERTYAPVIERYSAEASLAPVVQIYQKLADACNRIPDPERGVGYFLRIQGILEQIGSTTEKALLYNNLGYQYYLMHDSEAAIRSLEKAKSLCESSPQNCLRPEVYLTNLGIVHHNAGDSKTGIAYLLQARAALNGSKDKKALATMEHLIAKTYFGANDFYNALSHNALAIKYARENHQEDIQRNACKTAAEIYLELYDHENAIRFYRDYLRLDDSLRLAAQHQQRALISRQALLERTEKNTQLLLRQQTIQELYANSLRFEQEKQQLATRELTYAARQKEDSLQLLQRQQQISEAEARRKSLEILQLEQQIRYETQQRAADRELAELHRREELERARQQAKDSIDAQQIRLLQQGAEIANLQNQRNATFRRGAYALGVLGAIILALLGVGWFVARRTGRRLAEQNRRIEAQKSQIEAERAKSDSLLLNILPEEIADELKISGEATPRQYEHATVLFTDFVNFSRLTESLSPEQLIGELNECFLAFDHISERYGLEKIKTIGDAYMCVGGVPVPNNTHALDAVGAAIDMMAWLRNRNRANASAVFREMRIGIHTGPVIAGVVGKNKFAYDIWGDAVNLAARLEEHGAPGQINISAATFQLVREQFNCNYRGKKAVYNKGEVDMYFVEN